jgi:hypothetical protein
MLNGFCKSFGFLLVCSQVRHSYAAEDVVWDAAFAPCVLLEPGGGFAIDFGKFHDLVPVSSRGYGPHDTDFASHA